MFLSDLSIRRPVFAAVLMLALVTLGVFSYKRLAVDMFPDVEIPILSITTLFPGASPEAVEREVTRPIEEAVNPISGVKHVASFSREGMSNVVVEFHLEVKINEASQDARAKINAIRNELPDGLEDPVIQKFDIGGFPVVALAVRSKTLSARELSELADRKIRRRLETIAGVGQVKLVGDLQREVKVEIDPARIEALGMGVDEVIGGIASENVNTPLGRLNRAESEIPMRISGKPGRIDEFNRMVIARRGAHPVTLGDVARIEDGVEEKRSLALINGVPAVAIDVLKQSKANTVELVDRVKAEVIKLKDELPPGVEIDIVRDGSTVIRESLDDVQMTLLLGGLLTILIVFCFLNSWRSTVITGLTLPISVISAFIIMYFLGMTINMLTMMALSLAIGLLIDDAIVVRENIVRHLEHGADHFEASSKGTAEIGLAVMATSFSVVAVFIPVAFMKGVIGRFFYQFGLTVAFAVLVSLFVSFTLDPMLSSRWHDPDIKREGRRHFLARILDRFNAWFDRTADRYKTAIGWALDHRFVMLLIAGLAFVGGIAVFGTLQNEFMPPFDHGEFMATFKTAPGASIEETANRTDAVLRALSAIPEIDHTYAAIGARESDTVRDCMVYAKLKPKAERTRSQAEILPDVRRRLLAVPGIQVSIFDEPDSWEKPLQVNVRGLEIDRLKKYSIALKREMNKIRGIEDLEASMEHDMPEYRLVVNREKATSLGIGTASLVRTLGALVGGQLVSTYEDAQGESVDVRVRLPGNLRRDIRDVGDLKLAVMTEEDETRLVPVGDLVTVERAVSPTQIDRRDLSRQVVVSGNLDGLALGTAAEKSMAAASKVTMDPGYSIVMAGDAERMVESFGYLFEALLLAVVFVYLVLAAQFESFITPFAIMLSLPLSIVGMAGMLALTGDTISIMSLIGLIMLMGLVTKNAILLVDFTRTLMGRGLERREALITAGRTRLRPIMMTTLAMIFGMTPLALGLGQGAEMRAPMARAVIGGLFTSTLLTLLVVPVMFTLLDDVSRWIARYWSRQEKPAIQGLHRPALMVMALVGGALAAGAALAEPTGPAPLAIARAESAGVAASEPANQPAGTSARSSPSSPSARPLTLDEARAIALEKNRDIHKAEAYRQWVEGKYIQERAAALPNFKAVTNVIRSHDESTRKLYGDFGDFFPVGQDTIQADVTVTQTVFDWGKLGAAIKAAQLGRLTGVEQLRQARQAALRQTANAFFDVLLAREVAGIAQENLAQKERHAQEAERRMQLGTATDYDVLAADVAVKNARPDVIRAENHVRNAKQRLCFVLAEEDCSFDPVGTLEPAVGPAPSYEEVLASALEHRPELLDLRHRQGIQKYIIKIAAAGDKPGLEFRGGYGYRQYYIDTVDAGGKAWNAGFFIDFPFFDGWRTKGYVMQARSEMATLESETAKLTDAIRLQVRTSLDNLQEAAAIMESLRGTVDQARRLLDMAEKGFDYGVKIRLDVEDAQLNVLQAEGELARARRDYLMARNNLEWERGTLGETPGGD